MIEIKEEIVTSGAGSSHNFRMNVILKVLNEVFRPLKRCVKTSFNVIVRGSGEWFCFPVIVSYCFDIHNGKICVA